MEEDRADSNSYRKRWRPAPSSHRIRVKLMRDSGTLSPWMQQWVARTRWIDTLLFTYPQVRGYGYLHFCVRRLVIYLGVASASTSISPSTEATKVVKC